MVQIDDPAFYEVCLAGTVTFVVVLDVEDDPAGFALGLAQLTKKSVDWNPAARPWAASSTMKSDERQSLLDRIAELEAENAYLRLGSNDPDDI